MTPRKYFIPALTTAMVASALLIASPAHAAMPRILLKGGAAVVGFTWTATAYGRSYPSGSSPRYQWYRGDMDNDPDSYRPIAGATGKRYKVRTADHHKRIKVKVKAVRNGRVVGQQSSAPSNYVLWRMQPAVLSGTPQVGHTIKATLGRWTEDWRVRLYWRRTGNNIRGENGLTYRTRAADAGKEISLLVMADKRYPNGVYALDRRASRMRINWGTRSILKGTSPSRGRLGLTAIVYAAGTRQSTVRGRLAIYDGRRMIKRTWLRGGRKVVRFSGLRAGKHNIKMVFVSNPWFAGSRRTRTFYVH